MSDRVTGLVVSILALAFAASASQLEQPFFSDPLGPKAFPLMISSVAFVSGVMMVLRPDSEPAWPGIQTMIRLATATLILVGYAFALKPLGFLVPTTIAATALSYQIKQHLTYSVAAGVGLSIGLFLVFKFALGLGLYAFPRWMMG